VSFESGSWRDNRKYQKDSLWMNSDEEHVADCASFQSLSIRKRVSPVSFCVICVTQNLGFCVCSASSLGRTFEFESEEEGKSYSHSRLHDQTRHTQFASQTLFHEEWGSLDVLPVKKKEPPSPRIYWEETHATGIHGYFQLSFAWVNNGTQHLLLWLEVYFDRRIRHLSLEDSFCWIKFPCHFEI
jgi:hypothetical protein